MQIYDVTNPCTRDLLSIKSSSEMQTTFGTLKDGTC